MICPDNCIFCQSIIRYLSMGKVGKGECPKCPFNVTYFTYFDMPSDPYLSWITFTVDNYIVQIKKDIGDSYYDPGLYLATYKGLFYPKDIMFIKDYPQDISPANIEQYVKRLLQLREFS
jgi:hypothetical protein